MISLLSDGVAIVIVIYSAIAVICVTALITDAISNDKEDRK